MTLAKHPQHALQSASDNKINEKEEYRRQGGHDKNHAGGQQNFAAFWPDDLGHFTTHLLDELERVHNFGHYLFPS